MRNWDVLSALLLINFALIGACYLMLALALNIPDDTSPATVEIVPAAVVEKSTPLVTVIVVTRIRPTSTPTLSPTLTHTPTPTPSITRTPSRTPTDEPTKPPYVFRTPIPAQPTIPATVTPVRKRFR